MVSLVQRDFALARGWLDGLSLTGGAVAPWPGAPWSTRLTKRWPRDSELVDVLEPLRAVEAEVASTSLPGAVVHGDFWCGNVLTTKAGVSGVVDWEAAETIGNPLRDWTRFALSYSLYLDRHTRKGRSVAGHGTLRAARWGDGLRWALTGNGWYPDIVRSFLMMAVQRLDLPAAWWRHAAMLGLAEIAVVSDHETFARQHLEVLTELLWTPGSREMTTLPATTVQPEQVVDDAAVAAREVPPTSVVVLLALAIVSLPLLVPVFPGNSSPVDVPILIAMLATAAWLIRRATAHPVSLPGRASACSSAAARWLRSSTATPAPSSRWHRTCSCSLGVSLWRTPSRPNRDAS